MKQRITGFEIRDGHWVAATEQVQVLLPGDQFALNLQEKAALGTLNLLQDILNAQRDILAELRGKSKDEPARTKPITPEAIERDMGYVLNGTVYHEFLAKICPPRPGLTMLEPGCGSGKFGLWYAMRGARIVLLDIDGEVLDYTGALLTRLQTSALQDSLSFSLAEKDRVIIAQGSIFDMGFLSCYGPYDLVFNEGVAHHFPQSDPRRQQSLDAMVAMCRPGGTVCVMVSNARCPEMMQYAREVKHTYKGMPPTQEPFEPEELAEALEKAGLELASVQVAPVDGASWKTARIMAGWGKKPEAVP